MSGSLQSCSQNISNNNHWLKGPILNNTAFYICYQDEKQKVLYVLTYIPPTSSNNDNNTNLGDLIFVPLGISSSVGTPFFSNQSGNGYSISFTVNSEDNYIVAASNLFVPGTSAKTLIPTNAKHDDWAIFLAGTTPYTLQTITNTAPRWNTYTADPSTIKDYRVSAVVVENNTPKITKITTQIFAIPDTIYACGTCSTPGDFTSLSVEADWLSNNDLSGLPEFFTNLDDCRAGIWYDYCAKGTNCSKTCVGACPNGDRCIFRNTEFVCGVEPGPKKPIYEQTWFIITMIVLIIILMLLIIAIVYKVSG